MTTAPEARDALTMEELLAKVEAADGPNYQLECDILVILEPDRSMILKPPNYTCSLDAALALVEAKLPGAAWKIARNQNGRCYAATGYEGFQLYEGATPALVLIAAMLKALIAQNQKD